MEPAADLAIRREGLVASSSNEVSAAGRQRQRASAACPRCRRYRQKCVMRRSEEGAHVVPCDNCMKAGRRAAAECQIVPRGQSGQDRAFRRKRVRRSSSPPQQDDTSPKSRTSNGSTESIRPPQRRQPEPPHSSSSLLPAHYEVVEGVRVFTENYMQLGFMARAFFLEQVRTDSSSVSVFLLLSILALSARFTPSLIRRYGGARQASAEMRRRAMSLLGTEIIGATVERMQALFILGVNDFGEGDGVRSWFLTGIAIRMAAMLRLHKEETYVLPADATPDMTIASESARRSFWLVYCHDQQIAGRAPATTIPLSTVDVLLPAEEEDFIFGLRPAFRAAFPGSKDYALSTVQPSQNSLCATMIIGQWIWARAAEQACKEVNLQENDPQNPNSDYRKLAADLDDCEAKLPPRHVFNTFTLRAMKGLHLDLGYVSISILLRLAHIVLRRTYMPLMIRACTRPNDRSSFWQEMTRQMADNGLALYDILEQSLALRSTEEGFPAVFIFALYMCGDIAYSITRWPGLYPQGLHRAGKMLDFSMMTLERLEVAWPLASRWNTTLRQLIETAPDQSASAPAPTATAVSPVAQSPTISLHRPVSDTRQTLDPTHLDNGVTPMTNGITAPEPVIDVSALDIIPDEGLSTTLLAQEDSLLAADRDPFGADLMAFLRGEILETDRLEGFNPFEGDVFDASANGFDTMSETYFDFGDWSTDTAGQ